MEPSRHLPLRGINLDTADAYLQPDQARFLKNVVYAPTDTSQVGTQAGASTAMFKTIEAVEVYDTTFSLPGGGNQFAGGFNSEQTNQCFFFNYNSNGNHGLYLIDGNSRKITTVYLKDCLNLQLAPEHFVHEGGAWLEEFNYTDPITGVPKTRSYFMWVDGFNDFRFICIEDSIATSGFDANLFPYFIGDYDPCLLINAGVPTPLDCVTVSEVENTDPTKPNQLRFQTWQFRITEIDVYGRPSEHGIISTTYVPGVNDCISSSDLLSRCLDLKFKITNPLTDKVQIEFRNCNDLQWYTDTTLFLYKGSNLGDWWLRERNPSVNFDDETDIVTYQFCKDKECNPIDQAETTRTQNPMPKKPQSAAKVGKQISLWNNRDGFNSFGPEAMDYVSVEVVPPTGESGDDLASIEIYVPIWNDRTKQLQPVWVLNNQGVFGAISPTYFDNNPYTPNYENGIITDYKQNFGNPDQRGFIGYLAGTGNPPISTISEQYYVGDNGDLVKVENYEQLNFSRKYFQRFYFSSVARGKYIFRIAGHRSTLSDKNFDKTSTYVYASFAWNASTKQVTFGNDNYVNIAKELEIDACAGDYSSLNDNKVLAIYDLTSATVGEKFLALEFYTYETSDETLPVELLRVEAYHKGDQVGVTSKITDHNGFGWATSSENNYNYRLWGYCGCNNLSVVAASTVLNRPILYENKFYLNNQNCASFNETICNRVQIKGKVLLCGTNIPVPGLGVVYGQGGTSVTGADGTFTIIAHDNASGSPNAKRVNNIYFNSTICPYKNCEGSCLPAFEVIITPCVTCDERIQEVETIYVKVDVKRGLLSGGNYGVGITGHDWLGRHTFVQTKDSMYINMPSFIQTKVSSPSQIKLKIDPLATFPADIEKLTINITKELSLSDYIEWIVDRVEFVDNSGKENSAAPTQIKIYYASLNEYNVQNNFNTTTHWQFIVQQAPQINYTSDYVEFLFNGDGNFFPTLTRALIKYDQTGEYFLIDYDSALKDLKQYAKLRLNRPAVCATRDVFFELCHTIKVINGKAQSNEVILDAFDTYYKYRQIPIPIEVQPDNDTDEPTTENIIRSFGFPFEHHSPSDFWGEKCANLGRINTRNPYEAEIIRENQVALSGGLSVNGQLNYLNYFDDAQKTDFDTWNFDGVVSAIPFIAGVRVICQNGCFTVGFNDNIIRVNDAGQVVVPSASDKFGKPEVQIGNDYGCSLFDKNTVRKEQGVIQYLDSSRGYLMQDNFRESVPVSANVIDSWLRPKVKYINEWNRTHDNKKYFIGTIDPASESYILTDHTIGSTDFVNEERGYNIETQESVTFDIYNKAIRQWNGFSPQGYGMLNGNLLEKQLFSFAKNNVYYHYSTSPTKKYGTIYGQEVERIIRFVAVLDAFAKKQPLAIAVYCVQSKYFADQILTDSGQVSRLLLDHFKQGDFFSVGAFLCNLDTPADSNIPKETGENKIMDGDKLIGSIIDIRLIGDPSKNQVYTSYLGSTVGLLHQMQTG